MSSLLEIEKALGAKRKIDDTAIAVEEELKTGKDFSSYGAIVEIAFCNYFSIFRLAGDRLSKSIKLVGEGKKVPVYADLDRYKNGEFRTFLAT